MITRLLGKSISCEASLMIRRIRGNAFRYRIIPFLVSVDDFTEKSERKELHPHQQGEPPDDEKRAQVQGAGADPFIAEVGEHSTAEKDAHEPDDPEEMQRLRSEAPHKQKREQIQEPGHEPGDAVLGNAVDPGAMHHGHFRDAETLPLGHHRDEPVEVPVQSNETHHGAPVQFDTAVEIVEALAAHTGHGQIEKFGRPRLVPRIVPVELPAGNEVIALGEHIHHLRNFMRIVLQVPVKSRDIVAVRLGKSEGERVGLAAVELEAKQTQKGMLLSEILQDIPRTVAAAVIDDDDFKRPARGRYSVYDFFHQKRKIFRFILDRDYKTEIHSGYFLFFEVSAFTESFASGFAESDTSLGVGSGAERRDSIFAF